MKVPSKPEGAGKMPDCHHSAPSNEDAYITDKDGFKERLCNAEYTLKN